MTNHKKGILLTAIGVVLMSIEASLIKVSGLSALSVGFFFGIFIMISANLMLLSKGKEFFIQRYTISTKGLVLSGFLMGFSNFCFVLAVSYTGIAKSVLILAATPIISALIAFVFLKQKTPIRIFVATFFVFVGLYIIFSDDLGDNSLIGNFFALGCVLGLSTLFCILTFFQDASRLGYISFGGFFIALFSVWGASFDVTFTALLPIAFMGLFITPFSRLFIGLGTRYLIPAEVGFLVIGESVLAPIWGWLWLDEVISQTVFIGGAIILFSLIVNSLLTLKR